MTERTRANVQRAPRTAWCWLCRRATPAGVTIDTIEDGPQTICDACWEKQDDADVEEPLGAEGNREGDPAFNGAFDRW